MALKDLVADRNKLDEEAVERVVSEYIRYDPSVFQIVFTPAGSGLGNEAKILVYLVALLGWRYVLAEQPQIQSKPSDLELALGIHGGTLRPILKKLKDTHLITVDTGGHYSAQVANLDAIERLLQRGTSEVVSRVMPRSRRRAASAPKQASVGASPTSSKKRGSGQLKTALTEWHKQGYFSEARTLAALLDRYHEQGIITKVTSLSGLLLDAVREGLLVRTKVNHGGKTVWAYQAK